MIDIMATKNIDTYCIQVIWLDRDFIEKIDGYTFFHNWLKEKTCSRN